MKIGPIIREMQKVLVWEDGENAEEYDDVNDSCVNDDESDEEKILESNQNKHKIDMRNMLGFLNQNLYHDYLNITNIMKLKRLDFRDVYGIRCPDLMLTRENIIERVMLLITAYFCMGTELRFLKQMKQEGFTNTPDAEFWHGKALELAVKFLPGDAPLVKHIVSSYQKHHAPSHDKIPEEQEVEQELLTVKSFNGVLSNKVTPIIKVIDKASVKLQPLDLQPNDYVSDFLEKLNGKDMKPEDSKFQE